MTLGTPSIRFSGYLLQASQANNPPAQKMVSPSATTVSLQGAHTDQFTPTLSNHTKAQPRFGTFRDRNDDLRHGTPRRPGRECSANWTRDGRCDGSSEVEESDDEAAPTPSLRPIVPPEMDARQRRPSFLDRVLQVIERGADLATDQVEGYLDTQAELNQQYADVAAHAHIVRAAELLGIPRLPTDNTLSYATRVIDLVRTRTPEMEEAWRSRLAAAEQRGALEAFNNRSEISRWNLPNRFIHNRVHRPLTIAHHRHTEEAAHRPERALRNAFANHRHEHNDRLDEEAEQQAEEERQAEADRREAEERERQRLDALRVAQRYPNVDDGSGERYRISNDQRFRVYRLEDGTEERVPIRRR